MRTSLFVPLIVCALLTACGGDDAAAGKNAAGEDALPKPGAVSGGVTGMPNPGESTPQPVTQAAPEPLPDLADIPEQDRMILSGESDEVIAANEPGADAAVAVIRDYYSAINARNFAYAYGLWRQNPQSPSQFADGFAGTTGVSVEIGPPSAIDAGAGQRHIDIPVRLQATQVDGRVDQYAGTYILHRSVVEGGDPDWKISRAQLSRQ